MSLHATDVPNAKKGATGSREPSPMPENLSTSQRFNGFGEDFILFIS